MYSIWSNLEEEEGNILYLCYLLLFPDSGVGGSCFNWLTISTAQVDVDGRRWTEVKNSWNWMKVYDGVWKWLKKDENISGSTTYISDAIFLINPKLLYHSCPDQTCVSEELETTLQQSASILASMLICEEK